MKEITNKFLLERDKFMPEMHLREPAVPDFLSKFGKPGLHILLVANLLKTKKKYTNLMKQQIQDLFVKMNQIKLAFNMKCFMEILRHKALNIAKNPQYDGCQRGYASMFHKF